MEVIIHPPTHNSEDNVFAIQRPHKIELLFY